MVSIIISRIPNLKLFLSRDSTYRFCLKYLIFIIYHRTIKMAPEKVMDNIMMKTINNNVKIFDKRKQNFKFGQYVLICKLKAVFEKKKLRQLFPRVYYLETYGFYEHELQKVSSLNYNLFDIIIKKGKHVSLVHSKGLSKAHDLWVKNEALESVSGPVNLSSRKGFLYWKSSGGEGVGSTKTRPPWPVSDSVLSSTYVECLSSETLRLQRALAPTSPHLCRRNALRPHQLSQKRVDDHSRIHTLQSRIPRFVQRTASSPGVQKQLKLSFSDIFCLSLSHPLSSAPKLGEAHRSAASSDTIPTCENPGMTLRGVEPGSHRTYVISPKTMVEDRSSRVESSTMTVYSAKNDTVVEDYHNTDRIGDSKHF
ncbi:hypothetical protein PR048_005392 [Dryococelus australis]|uniref:Uncharacterized protein n=1 Tax=Dryococelus australis TaxID=614101 RepID=A0ABQ9I854_9NEOP|nr:hypothetical protein PR048_005392 [Dryococelus australis]